jgi:hypothetical protein
MRVPKGTIELELKFLQVDVFSAQHLPHRVNHGLVW